MKQFARRVRLISRLLAVFSVLLWGACNGGNGIADPCDGEECSGHGQCVVAMGSAACDCDNGYQAVGLTCVEVDEDAETDADAPEMDDAQDVSDEDDPLVDVPEEEAGEDGLEPSAL